MNLDFVFKSADHLRYENGKHVSGPHGGARRAIKVEPNINGGEGYTVTMYNLDGNHPFWQNNVQMAPKQMKIIQHTSEKIILRGYGYDIMGSSFADYGLTIFVNEGEVFKCVLHMHDRNVDIEYLPDEGASMKGLNWIQVLEIETFMNKIMEENAMFIQIRIWDEGKKHNMTLNKDHIYQLKDIKDYLLQKYPNNEFFRASEELIKGFYHNLISGNRIIEVDEELYNLNLNHEKLQTSDLEQRLKFLEAFNERIGIDIYWYNVLKEVVKQKEMLSFDPKEVAKSFLAVVNKKLKEEFGFSVISLDQEILPVQYAQMSNEDSDSIDVKLFSKLGLIKNRASEFKKSSNFRVFKKMCEVNNYDFYYENIDPEKFFKDSIAFSINLCLERILNGKNEVFGYDLRKTTSLYPQDIMNSPYSTLTVYITPFGFYAFNEVDIIFKKERLDSAVKEFLSNEFDVIHRAAVVDNENWISEWNRFNSSFIIGKNLKYRTFWGLRTKEFVDKLISGTFWFNDDVHGTNLGFIGLHPDSAYEGEQEYSMPAKNVLYYYSELRLEKVQWERDENEIYEAGYRNSELEEENEEYYDEW